MIFLASGFYRDVAILLVVSISLAAALSAVGGDVAHRYFGDTVADLIGDYGQYDLLVTINEGMRWQVEEKLQTLLQEGFQGAFFEEVISIAGKTTFLVSLGEERDRQSYTRFLRALGSISGVTSYNIMTEPRLSVRGVPDGAVFIFEDNFQGREGVDFLLPTRRGLEIMVEDPSYLQELSQEVEDIIASYRLLQIPLPDAADPGVMGEHLSRVLSQELSLDFTNISPATAGEMEEPLEQLQGIEELLLSYLTTFNFPDKYLAPGTPLYYTLEGGETGQGLPEEFLYLEVFRAQDDGSLAIIRGGEGEIQPGGRVFLAGQEPNTLGPEISQVEVQGLGLELVEMKNYFNTLLISIQQAEERLGQIQEEVALYRTREAELRSFLASFPEDSLSLEDTGRITAFFDGVLDLFARWDKLWQELSLVEGVTERWQERLNRLKVALSLRRLVISPTNPLEVRLRALEQDITSLQELLSSAGEEVASQLGGFNYLEKYRIQVEEMQSLLADLTHEQVDMLTLMEDLQSFLASGILESLEEQLIFTDFPGEELKIIGEIQATLPALPEKEMGETLFSLRQLLGHGLPGKEIVLLLPAEGWKYQVEQKAAEILGPSFPQPQIRELGIFQPDIRGELFRVIGEVRLTITAIMAIVFTGLTLLLDHTAIMSVIRELRNRRQLPLWLRPLAHEGLYGGVAGAVSLTGIIVFSGGELPYLEGIIIPVLGACLGFLFSFFCHKLNPVDAREFIAGESMGLTLPQIIREIVLPGARPGILALLNRPGQMIR